VHDRLADATVNKILMCLLDKNSPAEMASLTFLLVWIRRPIEDYELLISIWLAFVVILEYSILLRGAIWDNKSWSVIS